MMSKYGAYLKDKNGAVYDVNAEYLFDPKISTFVEISEEGELTVISPELIKRLYVVSNINIEAIYAGETYEPLQTDNLSPNLILSEFKFDGEEFEVTIKSEDGSEAKIYFVTSSGISISKVLNANTDKVYIPKGSSIDITINPGMTDGTEFIVSIEPDDGYVFDISYFKLLTPANVEANIIITNAKETNLLLSDNQPENTYSFYDSSDYEQSWFSQIKKIELYVRVNGLTTGETTVKLEYGGIMEAM